MQSEAAWHLWQRRFLIGLQTALMASWVPFEFYRRESLQRMHVHTTAEEICGVIFFSTILLLLVLGLFSFRTHQKIAVTGIVMSLVAIMYLMLLPGH